MIIKDLIEMLSKLNPNGVVSIVDFEQNNCYEIVEVRTCEDHSSEMYNGFADIVINLDGKN